MAGEYTIAGGLADAQRLARQAHVMAQATDAFLARIGLASGWSCLDVGCGDGQVTVAMARVAGPSGRTVGAIRRRCGTRRASTRSGERARARARGGLLPALAQEALEFPREDVAGGNVLLRRARVVGRRLLEALDECLHLGVGLHGG